MKVIALVVTYNRLRLLQETIEAITKQCYPPDQILVVDNFSTDGTREWLKKEATPTNLSILFLPENTGGAGGFYHGLKWIYTHHKPQFIWILDDDACPEKESLKHLLKATEAFPDGLAYFPSVYMRNGKPEYYSWPKKRFWPGNIWPLPKYSLKEIKDREALTVEVGAFLGLLLRTSIIASVGFPRPDFFLFFDDFEYTWRLAQKGALYFVPRARLRHHYRPPSLEGVKSYYFFRNWTYLTASYFAKPVLIRCFLCWLKWRFFLSVSRKQKISSRWALKGIADGLKGKLGKLPYA